MEFWWIMVVISTIIFPENIEHSLGFYIQFLKFNNNNNNNQQ